MSAPRLKLCRLTADTAKDIYTNHMVRDFPPAERVPRAAFIRALRQGQASGYGFYEQNELKSYAFFFRDEASGGLLLDYFAVIDGCRGHGYGTEALQLIAPELNTAPWIMLEVEDPDRAPSESEKKLRMRRIRFYQRSGMQPCSLRYSTFGVPFRIMLFPTASCPSELELHEAYLRIYNLKVGSLLRRINVRQIR